MARKTDGEKVDELEKFTTTLKVNLDNATSEVESIYQQLQQLAKEFNAHLRANDSEIKLLKHQVDELKKSGERTGQRLWMILAPLVSAVLASVATYFLGIKK